MEQHTHLADCIDSTEYESKYDTQAKNLTANKQVLAWIFKNTVEELKGYDLETIESCIEGTPKVSTIPVMPGRMTNEKITGMNTESAILDEGTVHFDIRCYVVLPESKERIKIILNLELQKEYRLKYHLPTRAIFYCARMLSEQADTEFSGDNYQDIKKNYSIWVCMEVPEEIANTISEYKIIREEVYGEFDEEEYFDLLTVVMIRLSNQEKVNAGNELIKMLTVLYSHKLSAEEKKKQLKEKFGMRMTKNVEGSLDNMCNLSQGVKEAGIRQGLQDTLKDVLKNLGTLPDTLCETIQNERSIELLKSWFTVAFQSDSLDEFLQKMNG